MNTNKLQPILESFTYPAYHEIPDVGLYLDQVVKYINSYLQDFPEMQITGSMVSNYVKQKLISSPHKKTYSRDQIAGLIFIATAKTVLSMDHIRMCLSSLYQFDSYEHAYEAFRSMLHEVLSSLMDASHHIVCAATSSPVSQALENIVITVAHKMYLERYFEEYRQEMEENAKKDDSQS